MRSCSWRTFLSSIFVSLHSLARILVRSCCPDIPSPLKCSCSPGRYSWQNQKKALDGFLGARGSTSDFLFLVPPLPLVLVVFFLGADMPVVVDGLVLGLACDVSWGRTVLAMVTYWVTVETLVEDATVEVTETCLTWCLTNQIKSHDLVTRVIVIENPNVMTR